jgi:hypothetical protein
MEQTRPEPDELSDDVLEGFLGDLKVPGDQRATATAWLQKLFRRAHMEHMSPHWKGIAEAKLAELSKELLDVVKAGTNLLTKIDKLSDPSRRLVEQLGWRKGSPLPPAFFDLLDNILVASDTLKPKARKRSGRPPKKFDGPDNEPSPFDCLIWRLYLLEGDCGWTVKIQPEQKTGTLVDFIKRARPCLPEGFVPRAVSWYRLQDIGAEARKAIRSAKSGSLIEQLRALLVTPLVRARWLDCL